MEQSQLDELVEKVEALVNDLKETLRNGQELVQELYAELTEEPEKS